MLVRRGVLQDQRPRLPLPIRVATVDSYQGREANVVILSCVRSNLMNAAVDLRFSMGFLSQAERANVAISRARELLVVIGNLQLLSLDPTFEQYVKRMQQLKVISTQRTEHNDPNGHRSDMVRALRDIIAKSGQDDESDAHGAHEKAWTRNQ